MSRPAGTRSTTSTYAWASRSPARTVALAGGGRDVVMVGSGWIGMELARSPAANHRSEHRSNALNGGKVAARAMLGQDTIPYFYTD